MSEYTKNEILQLLRTSTKAPRGEEFYANLMDSGRFFHKAAPWKTVPGPWAIRVVVAGEERIVVITGATSKAQRGLMGYRTLDDYTAGMHNFCLVVQFETSTPVFMKVPMTAADFVFMEVAFRAVAVFLSEAARMGGGIGSQGQGEALSPMEVLTRLGAQPAHSFSREGMQVQWGGSDAFPCRQVVGSSGQVSVHVVLSQSAIAQAQKDIRQPVPVPRKPAPLTADSSQCMVCLTTESDLRSRSLSKLQLCPCKSPTEKYCSKDCQKQDWARHKRTCKMQLARKAEKAGVEAAVGEEGVGKVGEEGVGKVGEAAPAPP